VNFAANTDCNGCKKNEYCSSEPREGYNAYDCIACGVDCSDEKYCFYGVDETFKCVEACEQILVCVFL
jgi:hypothetical protein